MSKRVFITAFIGSDNLGDEAIFRVICQKLSKIKGITVSAITLDKDKQSDIKNIRLIQTKNPFTIVKEIARCDLLICGGGGIIQDATTIYSLLRHTYKTLVANLLGKKYMFYAVGVDNLISPLNKALARFLFNRATAITVRDEGSKINLQKIGVDNKIVVTADPVISIVIPSNKDYSNFDFPTKGYIAVCLRHWFDINRYLPVATVKKLGIRSIKNQKKYVSFVRIMADFLDSVVARYDINIVFLNFFQHRDNKVHEDVIEYMQNKNRCHNFNQKLTYTEVLQIISKAEILIGMRLHSLIFSAVNYTPFLGIIYAEKVNNFLDESLFSKYGVQVDNLKEEILKSKFDNIYKNRNPIRQILKVKVPQLQSREKQNIEIVKRILVKE